MRILLVDDSEMVRRGIRSLLDSQTELSICGEAADGVEAVEMARQLRPDVVLMDISMPRMDGLEATRALRRDLPEMKILIVSQNDPAAVQRQAKEVDAHGYIAKSDLPHDLIPLIKRIFDGHCDSRSLDQAEALSPACFAGEGEMNAAMRATDWSKTLLGTPQTWPPALHMMVKFMLANRFPQLLWWGPQFCSLYNDAYVPILGTKHPWAIGRQVSEVWKEIWHVLKPLIEAPYNGGPSTWIEDISLEIDRRGFFEETHFTTVVRRTGSGVYYLTVR
jgi:DNA-binding NarL/FixJ family response regulator